MPEARRAEFEAAVAAFPLDEIDLDPKAVAVAGRSLERTGLVVLGESHGLAETASAILTLVRALGVRTLGLEWSYDEVGAVVDAAVAHGRFDLDSVWAVPAGGDLFAGDGRFTAGHVRVLEQLLQEGALVGIIPFDRLDQEAPFEDDREEAMASRILSRVGQDGPMLAVTGYFHATRQALEGAEPMFVHLERSLPGLSNGIIDVPGRPVAHEVDARFTLPRATAAVWPRKG